MQQSTTTFHSISSSFKGWWSHASAACLLVLGLATTAAGSSPGDLVHRLDTAQAEVMLEYLELASKGPVDDSAVTAVLAEPGTSLIIGQMNLMRRVTEDQYATILRSIRSDEPPEIAPADESERSQRGVVGLTQNVWPNLRWGLANTALLAERIDEIRSIDVYDTARNRAMAMLPEPADVSAEIFVVMGGRAGAAALAGDKIYVDILMLSHLDSLGRRPYDAEKDLVDFFAHEMHHVGYHQILEAHRNSLDLDTGGALTYSLLSSVVSEGSATYLVSGHRDLDDTLSGSGAMSRLSEQRDELLGNCERVALAVQSGEIANREQYDAATEFLLGAGAHVAGSLMLSRIDDRGGLEAVMRVLADPRKLLVEYNAAAAEGDFAFDAALADAVAGIAGPE
jgi:hypothetical protein